MNSVKTFLFCNCTIWVSIVAENIVHKALQFIAYNGPKPVVVQMLVVGIVQHESTHWTKCAGCTFRTTSAVKLQSTTWVDAARNTLESLHTHFELILLIAQS